MSSVIHGAFPNANWNRGRLVLFQCFLHVFHHRSVLGFDHRPRAGGSGGGSGGGLQLHVAGGYTPLFAHINAPNSGRDDD